jgi:hypothetical protein
MNTTMFGVLGLVTGSLTATAVWHGQQWISHHKAEQDHMRQLMYAQVSPIEQGPGNGNLSVPPGVLPLDATPTPGVVNEPGSARPWIQLKPSFSIPTQSQRQSATLVLKRTDKTIKETKDPLWELQLVATDGKVLEVLPALTGRAYRQTADRNIAGNKSPLPKGTYSIDRGGIASAPFSDPELGKGYWVPITPLFSTGRSALGFHQDPSWGKQNGESGTSGCVGLANATDTAKLVDWIKHFNVTRLVVES